MKYKRIQWLDFGKGFTILCVILFHCTQFIFPKSMLLLRNTLEVFMMPVFFAISGYLYRPNYTRKNYLLLIYKKISGFVIPYSFFAIILFVLNKFYFLTQTPWGMPHSISLYFPFLHGAYLWFLLTLFLLFLIVSSVIYLFKSENIYEKAILVLLILILLILAKHTGGIKNLIYWVICFGIGYYFKIFELSKYYKLMRKILFPLFIFWLTLLCIQFKYESISEYDNGSNPVSGYSIIPAFLSILVFFMIFILFNHNDVIFKRLCKYGRYTLLIYLIHFPIMLIIGKYLKHILISRYLLLVILIVIVWMASFVSCKLLRYSIINFVFYPKRYITKYISKTKWGSKFLKG